MVKNKLELISKLINLRVESTVDPRGAPRQRGGGTPEGTGPVTVSVLK